MHASNNILYYIQTRHTDEGIDSNAINSIFRNKRVTVQARHTTTSTGTINNMSFTSGYSVSEMSDSGDILYIENRAPITRRDQTENIKLV